MSSRSDLPARADVVVVGAGSAGAVVAARLSERGSRTVLLLEAGPDHDGPHTPPSISGASFLQAMNEPGRMWPRLMATRTEQQGPRPYARGLGVGGSSAVNAMVALPGEPSDYDEWERTFGCTGWGWADVAPWFARIPIPLRTAARHEVGTVSHALLAAEPAATLVPLTRTADGRRASTNDVYLEPARQRPNLTVRGQALVDRVLLAGNRAVGVRLADGSEVEAGAVVMCAGAIHTPAVLLRSGVQRDAIGHGLQDHPSFPIALHMREGYAGTAESLAVSCALRATHADEHDLQLLALDVVDATMPWLGLLMGAVMRVHSLGSLRLAGSDPWLDPVVELHMLDDERDVQAMRAAADLTERVALSPQIAAVAEVQPYDASDAALRTSVGDYVHAVGTCRMGAVHDPLAVVDPRGRVIDHEGLYAADASVMPRVPRANTHLPAVMVAERIAAMFDAAST
ncbi:MAG: GMC family oxidoreductase N-terminal domain-containing protein [Actinomycetota bacterium]|nr:GMC family oxidoreductase N-terminal domain-containing protein [Actinomycetota bacterium]